jgi:hypothetical protein
MATQTEPTFFAFQTLGITAAAPASSFQTPVALNQPTTTPEPSPFASYPIVIPTTRAYGFSG